MVDMPQEIGPYQITRELGRGGMGVVYLALDTKLDRSVAIKVLPESMACDGERVLRFEREAKLLASLNHTNIAQIYGFEESDDKKFLVLEYVNGETLADRFRRGALPVDEAIEVCRQIAEALEAAHDKSVIHRDLKPGNVMVKADGTVKVLDFGLARAMQNDSGSEPAAAESPTITANFTRPGVILGTAPYMSPEQARGRPLDKRTDIWSFGVVLYECLTGQTLFRGETATDSMGAIMHRDPDWSELPPETPWMIRHVLHKCLERERKQRLRDIGDARIEIETAQGDPDASSRYFGSNAAAGQRISRTNAGAACAAAIILLFVAFYAAWSEWLRPRTAAEPVRLVVATGTDAPLTTTPGTHFAISPDGSRLAFIAAVGKGNQRRSMLYVRSFDEFEATLLPMTEDARLPFFSPSGEWIGYFSGSGPLRKILATGGLPITLCERPPGMIGPPRGGSWGEDGHIVFSPGTANGLYRVAEAGGEPAIITRVSMGERSHRWPFVAAGGDVVLFTTGDREGHRDTFGIEALRVSTGERVALQLGGSNPRYVRSGHILFGRGGKLYAAPFDAGGIRVTGPPTLVLDHVVTEPNCGAVHAVVADSGKLLYAAGGAFRYMSQLQWCDREGNRTIIDVTPRPIHAVALSPAGDRIAMQLYDSESGFDIWSYEIARDLASRVTSDDANEMNVLWSPDGREIAYTSTQGDTVQIWASRADGVGDPRRIAHTENAAEPSDWIENNDRILFDVNRPGDIMMVSADGSKSMSAFLATPFWERRAQVSPDARWIAYESDRSGPSEVYLRPFPEGDGRWQVSIAGGSHPVWSGDGSELFFHNGMRMFAVDVDGAGETPLVGVPNPLFDFTPSDSFYPQFDVSSDGQRFVVISELTEQVSDRRHLSMVLNWGEELSQLTSDSR